MRLTNWLTHWLPRSNRTARRARTQITPPKKAKTLAVESLEGRLVPSTTVYLEFGLGLDGVSTDVTELRNLDKQPDGTRTDTGPNLAAVSKFGLAADADLTFHKLAFDYNQNGVNGDI